MSFVLPCLRHILPRDSFKGAADRSKGQPHTDSRTARPVNTCHCVLDTGATMKNIWFGSWRLAAPEKQRVFLMLVLV